MANFHAVYKHTWLATMYIFLLGTPPYITQHPTNKAISLYNNTTNLSISCVAEGATSFMWQLQYHYDIPSYIATTIYVNSGTIVNTSVLVFVNLQPNYTGNYQCLAKNDSGTSHSPFATVTIDG